MQQVFGKNVKVSLPKSYHSADQWRGGSEAAGEAARSMAPPPPPSHTFFASWSGTRPRDACHVIGTTCNDRRSLRNTFGWMGALGRI